MKRILVVLLALTVCASVASANGLGVYGSYFKFKDADKGGFGGGGKLQMSFGEYVGLELRGTYFPDVARSDPKLVFGAGELDLILLLPLSETVKPYVGGGAGYYVFDLDAPGVETENKLGWFGVAGVQVGVSDNVAFFGEGKYISVEADVEGAGFNDVTDTDEKLTGFGGNVGLMFIW